MLSIIESCPTAAAPTVIWHHREYTTISQTNDPNRVAKKIATAAMNASMMFNNEGLRALHTHDARARITRSYATIAAPWSYTINKTVNYALENNQTFDIDTSLITHLIETAENSTESELQKHDHLAEDLHIITHQVDTITANGYEVQDPIGQKATQLAVSHTSALAQKHIISLVDEVFTKVLPSVEIQLYSFMIVLSATVRQVFRNSSDYCLLDITHEAVEIGIVRNNSLTYCSHTANGINSLIRAISEVADVPVESAIAYLKASDPKDRVAHIPEHTHSAIEAVLEQYRAKLSTICNETGDTLAAPRTIYLHCHPVYEPFFQELITTALRGTSYQSFAVKSVGRHINTKLKATHDESKADTRPSLAAYFFHNEVTTTRISSN